MALAWPLVLGLDVLVRLRAEEAEVVMLGVEEGEKEAEVLVDSVARSAVKLPEGESVEEEVGVKAREGEALRLDKPLGVAVAVPPRRW